MKFIPFLLTLSCLSFSLSSEWKLSYLITPTKEFNSLRLLYKNESPFEWTYSEITATSSGIRYVLNLTLRPLSQENSTIEFKANIDSENRILKGYLFGGGEKILLSKEDADWVIYQLLQDKNVNLEFEFYKTTVQPDKFRHLWARAKHLLANEKIALKLK